MAGSGSLLRAGGVAVPVVLALAVLVGGAGFAYEHRYSTRVAVPIHATGSTAGQGWTLGSRAVLASDGDGPTLVLVPATRRTAVPDALRLVTEFDGSGGGDAVEVDCASDADAPWTTVPGGREWLVLRCDRSVEPFALRGLEWIRVTAG